jgi:hypothetical protein
MRLLHSRQRGTMSLCAPRRPFPCTRPLSHPLQRALPRPDSLRCRLESRLTSGHANEARLRHGACSQMCVNARPPVNTWSHHVKRWWGGFGGVWRPRRSTMAEARDTSSGLCEKGNIERSPLNRPPPLRGTWGTSGAHPGHIQSARKPSKRLSGYMGYMIQTLYGCAGEKKL